MPMGSATWSSGTDRPVRRLKPLMKKSAYLQYPSSPRLMTAETHRQSFAPAGRLRYFSASRPNI